MNEEDVVILLGDVGANYYGGKRDQRLKESFSTLKPTFLCIHGNHEMRPASLNTYIEIEWNGGTVWYETEYPNLLFAKDGEIYTILAKRVLETEKIGIVPQGVFPAYCDLIFEDKDIVDYMNLPFEETDKVAEKCVWYEIPDVELIE